MHVSFSILAVALIGSVAATPVAERIPNMGTTTPSTSTVNPTTSSILTGETLKPTRSTSSILTGETRKSTTSSILTGVTRSQNKTSILTDVTQSTTKVSILTGVTHHHPKSKSKSKASILTGVTRNSTHTAPTNPTSPRPNPHPHPTNPHSHPHPKPNPKPNIGNKTTILTTTKTSFVPCSTPIKTWKGKTYYSTYVTPTSYTKTYTSVIPRPNSPSSSCPEPKAKTVYSTIFSTIVSMKTVTKPADCSATTSSRGKNSTMPYNPTSRKSWLTGVTRSTSAGILTGVTRSTKASILTGVTRSSSSASSSILTGATRKTSWYSSVTSSILTGETYHTKAG